MYSQSERLHSVTHIHRRTRTAVCTVWVRGTDYRTLTLAETRVTLRTRYGTVRYTYTRVLVLYFPNFLQQVCIGRGVLGPAGQPLRSP